MRILPALTLLWTGLRTRLTAGAGTLDDRRKGSMDEAEWTSNPSAVDRMVDYCAKAGNERKLRLFLHACCCRIEYALADARSRAVLCEIGRYAEGPPDQEKLMSLRSLAQEAYEAVTSPFDADDLLDPTPEALAAEAVLCLTNPSLTTKWEPGDVQPLAWATIHVRFAVHGLIRHRSGNREVARAAERAEFAAQAELLHEVFGNPFRPATLDVSLRTPTVLSLATGIYEDRAFDRLPILADALMDVGCSNDELLNHLREPGPHVRGCWALDLVLGKA